MAGPLGMPTEAATITSTFRKLIEVNDLPPVVFYSLRHTSITYKLKLNGGDIKNAVVSAVLSQRKITEEWLYELMQDGTAHNLFVRPQNGVPSLGDSVTPSMAEKNRFSVYAEDFAGHDSQLFLQEMNRGKKYDSKGSIIFLVGLTLPRWGLPHRTPALTGTVGNARGNYPDGEELKNNYHI